MRRGMTQFEQENDLGRGGGEVDDETMRNAEREADRRRSSEEIPEDERDRRSEGFGPATES